MAESLVGVVLRCRHIHNEPLENRQREYEKISRQRIPQGRFGKVSRMRHSDPDGGADTLVVVKEVTHQAEYEVQQRHELECIRSLNDHRFWGHVIKLLDVYSKVEPRVVANIIVMERKVTMLVEAMLG